MGKISIETYVHIVLIALTTVIGVCFIGVSMQHSIAQKLHASVIEDVEASDFSETVIEELLTKVNSEDGEIQEAFPGAELTIQSVVNDGQTEAANTKINKVAEVKLTYYYSAFIFTKPIKYELVGYAR